MPTHNQVQPPMGQSTNRACKNSVCMVITVCVGGKDTHIYTVAHTINISDAFTIGGEGTIKIIMIPNQPLSQ